MNGEGEDAGVVYCEMQGRENMERSRTYLNFTREMYPGHCGYKVTKFDAYVYSVDVPTLSGPVYMEGGHPGALTTRQEGLAKSHIARSYMQLT